jgi:uncharacterized protein (DUF1015 family)
MAKIKPFCGIYYNQEKISDISSVICPPYDIISPAAQEYYHNRSSYNTIYLEFGRDVANEDKYKRAKDYLDRWTKEEMLIQDKSPAIYFYNQEFNVKGERKSRLGFLALLRLEDKEGTVLGHEYTRLEAKEDRLNLIRRVKANLSPIFVLFSDEKRLIKRTYERYLKETKPMIDIIDQEKIAHQVWRLNAQEALTAFGAQMEDRKIYIADGHHRYEVALSYREEMKKKLGGLSANSDLNYIMAYFTNIESRGLSIFPAHRLVKEILQAQTSKLKESLGKYFDIQEVKEKDQLFFLMEKAGTHENTFGVYHDKKFYLLRLKNVKILDKEMLDKPKEYRHLDVTILNFIILKRILGLELEDKEKIKFYPHNDELISQVDGDKSSIAFFLNPVKIEQLVSIASQGERMPSKSTYFYPKVPAGLIINKFK